MWDYSFLPTRSGRNRTARSPRGACSRRNQTGEALTKTIVAGDYESFSYSVYRKLFPSAKGNGGHRQRFSDPFVGYGADRARRVTGT
ncbi:MAG TPA: hypothetical protein DCZ69_04470 [Syntrophobacteraceae bacterium]|nr:hypothetical protein [Syntrophobacteraceae bacterium]